MTSPPFTLAALEASLGKRLAVPTQEIQSIATHIYARYENTGPSGTMWRLRETVGFDTAFQVSYQVYDLCRADWIGIYLSPDRALVQTLADVMNELEGRDSTATA